MRLFVVERDYGDGKKHYYLRQSKDGRGYPPYKGDRVAEIETEVLKFEDVPND